ncbi:SUKH-4 family immunity protein [Streptomyces sp. NPDC056411]|uniref:SUKH-4 family immunity protein n=1 Tax=Streptomyces sp. NPDC056411 TaxID=3345813 RepID=UPI0035DFC2EB
MITNEILAATYGEENIVTMPFKRARQIGLSPLDSRMLAFVGLPRESPPIFTTRTQDGPDSLSVHGFKTDGEDNKILILGAPADDNRRRFCLDVRDEFIVLILFKANESWAEIVNSSLDSFVEFIYRIQEFRDQIGKEPAESRQTVESLRSYLRDLDPPALEESDSWWSVALDRLSAGEGTSK